MKKIKLIIRWTKLIQKLPQLLRLIYSLLKDKRVPIYLKTLLVATIFYFFAPFDIIPDFVPFSGILDDLTVILLVISQFLAFCDKEVIREHLHKSKIKEDELTKDIKLLKEVLGKKFEFIKNNLSLILSKYRKNHPDQN